MQGIQRINPWSYAASLGKNVVHANFEHLLCSLYSQECEVFMLHLSFSLGPERRYIVEVVTFQAA